MKVLHASLLVVVLVALTSAPAGAGANEWAQYTLTQAPDSSGLTADLQAWLVTGDLSWRIRIPTSPNPPLSELIFPAQTTLPLLTLSRANNPPYGFTLRFASGGINQGTSTDSDWLTTSSTPSLQSQQPSSGNIGLWGLEATYQFKAEERATYAAFIGWQSWTYNIRMVDPVTYTTCDPTILTCPPLGVPLTLGLNSTYDITYSGPRLGIRATRQVSDKITLTGSASLGWISATGTGNWNLRSLRFTHEGNGTATAIEVAIGWTPTENWMVRLGYTVVALSVAGRETLFCDPSFCGDPGLDWDANVTNQGVTLAATYQW